MKKKTIYKKPQVQVLFVSTEHIIAATGTEAMRESYGSASEDTWE